MKLTICFLVLISCFYGLSASNEIQSVVNGLDKAINELKNAGNNFSKSVANKSHGLVGKIKDSVEKVVQQFGQHEANTLNKIKNFINTHHLDAKHAKCIEEQSKPIIGKVKEITEEVHTAINFVSQTENEAAKCSGQGKFKGALCYSKLGAQTVAKSIPLIKKDKDTVEHLIPLINNLQKCH
ncbi:uncharacterized protein LOC123301656 [Chrysoperla carnea]|uniref:uncharacterized protein LOC123301656 n=1 Tax=Chrysoperla carnea TaxID=189513 RepID=UPI001D0683BC|nr:uncharacterized protein LOC123301656 [Chrysoperla carnea]